MRVAIVANPQIPIPPPKYGGIENVIYYLIKGLKEKGHEPVLLGTGDSIVDCELVPIADRAIGFPRKPSGLLAYERKLERVYRNTYNILKRMLPDINVIHSHGFDLLPFADFPNVTTLHGNLDFRDLRYYEARKHLNFVSISMNQRGGFPGLNWIGNVYNGEDPDKFIVSEKPEDYVFFMGRFDYEKRPHYAIELALALGKKIKVAGKVDFQGSYYFDKEVKHLLKNPLVEFLGEINMQQKVQLLKNAYLNLHPVGWREPFGLNVLEAAYSGTPTLAVSRGSMPELIRHFSEGILVEDFIEGYHLLKSGAEFDRERIAKRARKTFNYRNMARGYIRAYRRAIRRSASRSKVDFARRVAPYTPGLEPSFVLGKNK